jgi:two-component system alkaline phosphatase synthesis response regulator PhoP
VAKILVVDDEPEIVVLTKIMLEREGHEVSVAKNSAECFERLKEEKPDLILMDIMMPGDDGWEACRKIKGDEKTRDILVAMFTVRTSEDSVERSLKYAHADAHINKPFDRTRLVETIRSLVG